MVTRNHGDFVLYRRMLRQIRPYWALIALFFVVSMLDSPLTLLQPVPLQIAVDTVLGSKPLPGVVSAVVPEAILRSNGAMLVLIAGSYLIIAFLNKLQGLATAFLRTYVGEKMVRGFRAQLFRHAQRLSLSYHDTVGTADSIYRIQSDAPAIQYVAIDGVIPFLTAACTVLSMIYVILRLDWQLALVALAVSPVLLAVSGAYRKPLRSRSREVRQLESSTQAVVQEALGAMRVVKAFAQEDREHQRFVHHSTEGMRASLRLALIEGRFGALIGLTTALGTTAVLLIGVLHVQSGQLTLGELLMVLGYISKLYGPLKTISGKAGSMQSHLASAERAFALLDEAPDVSERPNARPLIRSAGAVAFRNVSFAYGPERPVLHDISFEAGPGTRLGIAGTTGAGKTTLVSLLTRFYDPTSGQILLDGIDLRDYKLADLRNQFGIVLQEPVLFSASIAENIAYARPGAREEEIVQAAKLANVHDFIASLPAGYETLVGERGMRLSGGERQRISLARAFLKDAPVLILDEPTSAVDIRTEAAIVESMERLMQGRTAIIIAHRSSTLRDCDLLMRIENGHLIELASGLSLASG